MVLYPNMSPKESARPIRVIKKIDAFFGMTLTQETNILISSLAQSCLMPNMKVLHIFAVTFVRPLNCTAAKLKTSNC